MSFIPYFVMDIEKQFVIPSKLGRFMAVWCTCNSTWLEQYLLVPIPFGSSRVLELNSFEPKIIN